MRLFSSIPSYLKPLFKTLQCRPNKLALYIEALSHKSGKHANTNYERLEFLGDAILSSIFADYIYHHFPKEREGEMSKLRARAVNRKTLNKLGVSIDIKDYMDCDPSLLKDESSIPGNCMEAIFGAIYLDKGYKKAYKIILDLIKNHLELQKILLEDTNFKSQLLEWGQKEKKEVKFNAKEKELHYFYIDCIIEGKQISKSEGNNKKKAEQKAAELALKKLSLI